MNVWGILTGQHDGNGNGNDNNGLKAEVDTQEVIARRVESV